MFVSAYVDSGYPLPTVSQNRNGYLYVPGRGLGDVISLPAPAVTAPTSSWTDYLPYLAGAALLVALFVYMRDGSGDPLEAERASRRRSRSLRKFKGNLKTAAMIGGAGLIGYYAGKGGA